MPAASPVPPPIDEVVMGFQFDEVPAIDPVLMGAYLAKYPTEWGSHEIREPMVDPNVDDAFHLGKLRTWLISKDESMVLQTQNDRVYVNWRRRNDARYPGFTKHVLEKNLGEYRRFEDFCKAVTGLEGGFQVHTIDLTKIDLVTQGVHWSQDEELPSIMPALAPALNRLGLRAGIAMRWLEPYPDGAVHVAVAPVQMRKDPNRKALRVESKLTTKRSAATLEEQFAVASEALNAIFAKIAVLNIGD
jgi:hypothetical protein